MSDFTELRRANLAREKERDPTGKITASYRATELGGEIAEALIALNICKKLERERLWPARIAVDRCGAGR